MDEKLSMWVKLALWVISLLLSKTGQMQLTRTLYNRFEDLNIGG